MSSDQIASALITLTVLVAAAHLMGQLFERLRQPKLIGEILVGILFGRFVLGRLSPSLSTTLFGGSSPEDSTGHVLGFTYWLGLLLLMFVSGSSARKVLGGQNRRPTMWILGVGLPLPFLLTLTVGSFLPLESLAGPASHRIAVLLILSIAVAVMSIPVISRIFYDLGILHTRFASLVLGVAILEDIVLWAVVAVATALASSAAAGQELAGTLTTHISATVAYMAIGLTVAPRLLKRLHDARWNGLVTASPVAYAMLTLLAYAAVAALMEVNVVFAAFLAGFGLVGGMHGSVRQRFAEPLAAIEKVAFAVFIPLYFLMVGYQLQLGEGFSFLLLGAFLVGSSLLRLGSIGLAARCSGFGGLDLVNLAVASNARGGPGIVLASVAFEAGIINGRFFTTLVLTAILTSQAAGVWLGHVLRKGWPLLSEDAEPLDESLTDIGPDPRQEAGSTQVSSIPKENPEAGRNGA